MRRFGLLLTALMLASCGSFEVTADSVGALEPDIRSIWPVGPTEWNPDSSRMAVPLADFNQGDSTKIDETPTIIQVIDFGGDKPTTYLEGHSGPINGLAWSPDGNSLASASGNGTVRIWDVDTDSDSTDVSSKVLENDFDESVRVSWSPDGTTLATSDKAEGIIFWDTKTWDEVGSLDTVAVDIEWSPDSSRLLAGVYDLTLWDPKELRAVDTIPGDADLGAVLDIAWSPDGDNFVASGSEGSVALWDVETKKRQLLTGHSASVNAVAWSPDSSVFASGGNDGALRFWDRDTGRTIGPAVEVENDKGTRVLVESMTWSAGGRLATDGAFGSLTFWEFN